MSAREPAHKAEGGFTLLEVVVALAILGLSLSMLFGIFSLSMARTRASEVRESERALAHSLLQSAVMSSEAKSSSGRTGNGLLWQIQASPFGSEEDNRNWPNAATRVTVTVLREGQPGDHVTLSTLRLGPKERVE